MTFGWRKGDGQRGGWMGFTVVLSGLWSLLGNWVDVFTGECQGRSTLMVNAACMGVELGRLEKEPCEVYI